MKSPLAMAAVFLALAGPAHAASVDMNTRTCQDWLDSDEDEQEQTIAWLRGYLSAKSGSSLYDFGGSRVDTTALKRYCQTHLTVGVISAAGQWGH
jgi:opacity protein-like surface antigen